jgi:hypothetical protein
MQPFRIRKDARNWFKELLEVEKSFKLDFDAFYFCFLAGIAARRKESAPNDDTAELVPYFPDRYRQRARLYVALFLASELKLLGVTIAEKEAVHAEIGRLVDPGAQSSLSDDGVREFNRYAYGGFEVLLGWFDDRPRSLEAFIRSFKQRIDAQLGPVSGSVNEGLVSGLTRHR